MALLAKYHQFLANPTADLLASTASIHYVPTVTSINDAAAILKHIKSQQQLLTKKEEKILNVFENSNNLFLETDTTLQFDHGGGTYLPGLDDNFLAEKVVNVVIMHIVTFDTDEKILQVRLHWDQGSLLKAVDTIGARGRNWPIHLGKDQAALIATSTAAAPNPTGAQAAAGDRVGRTLVRGVDPASSLSLFAPRDPNTLVREESQSNVVAPRQSAKPPPREWGELFVGGDSQVGAAERSPSPSKLDNPLKYGAGKHYKDMRVFNPEDEAPTNKGIKTDARKYQHFEFGETEFQPSPIKHDRTKHMSQWDFADFTTPAKAKQRPTASQDRHFDFHDVAGAVDEAEAKKPLVWAQPKPQPRQDAYAHFEITDSAPPEKPEPPLISRNSQSQTLYHDPVFGDFEETQTTKITSDQSKQPLGNITNTNINATTAAGRHATWDSHWESKDVPSPSTNENDGISGQKKVSEATQKVVKGMEAGWELFDGASEPQRGIKILGNGSGSAKAPEEKSWWEY